MLTDFQKKVLVLTSQIPKSKVTTYGEIARKLQSSPRAVGQALGANPRPVLVPCHRVVKSGGGLGGYSGGVNKKKRLLRKEGIKIQGNKIINFQKSFIKLKNAKRKTQNLILSNQ